MACTTRERFVPLPSSVVFVATTCSVMRTCVPRTVRMRSISVPPPPLVTRSGATLRLSARWAPRGLNRLICHAGGRVPRRFKRQ